jgi:hypothetical protein
MRNQKHNIPEGCVPICRGRTPCKNVHLDNDKCILNEVECVRNTTTYICKKQQYLESTGKYKICEPGSTVSLKKAIISSLNEMKDVTCEVRYIIGQLEECHQLDFFEIDTGKLNEYSGGDIEACQRKLIQIEYTTKERCEEDKTVCKIKKSCRERKKCRRKHREQPIPCPPPRKEKRCRKKPFRPPPCPPKPCFVHYNKMLLFPLFPIRGAYVYPLVEPKCSYGKCNGKCTCH